MMALIQEIGERAHLAVWWPGPHHLDAVADALGREPETRRYSPEMSRHAFLGDNEATPEAYRELNKVL